MKKKSYDLMIVKCNLPWTVKWAGGDSLIPTIFSAMQVYLPSSPGLTSDISKFPVFTILNRPNPVLIFSPFRFHEIIGSG